MFETLYKKNVNGTINQWSIHFDEKCYWTEFGQVNGVITKSDNVYCEDKNIGKKNETTVKEQVLKEAESIWKKKIKSENFVVNINDVDNKSYNPPMLAKEYDLNYTTDLSYIQPKLDGIRCNMWYNGNCVEALSRKNNEFYTVEHIKEYLHDILKNYPTIHLDGELYNHYLCNDFNKVVSLVRKEKITYKERKEIVSYVRYNVYDLWDDNNPDMTFSERNELIKKLLSDVKFVDIVPTFEIKCSSDVEHYFNIFTNDGYEGAILRKDLPYEHKRSKNLLKYKKFKEEEFEILDICEGKTKGIAEYAWVKINDDIKCKATLSFKDEECAELLKNKNNIIGKMATIKFFGYTTDGKLRFPIFKAIRNYE